MTTAVAALALMVSQTWAAPTVLTTGPRHHLPPPLERTAGRPTTVVQVVAHQDDDLLFMNPDLSNSIRAGLKVTTVYVTGGAAGAGAAYAAHRQDGARLAYARMAGEATGAGAGECADDPGPACWDRENYRPAPGGPVAERFTLKANRSLQLVFLNLPEYADSSYLGGNALRRLWETRDSAVPARTATLDMDGPGTVWPQVYDGKRLLGMLDDVLADQRPTLVRVQDPAPDPTLWTAHADHDHPDHISAAWFADAAVAEYTALGRQVLVEHYRDYNTWLSPAVLSSVETAAKYATFRRYAGRDVNLPTGAAFAKGRYGGWQSRQYLRSPRSTQVVAADRTGTLHAFAVESGSLLEWAEDEDKVWHGPVVHERPGGPLAAGLTVTRRGDGGLAVFGQRADTGEIVSRTQDPAGEWTWTGLGSPDTMAAQGTSKLADPALQVSLPVSVADGTGRLHVFVRNRGGGISSRTQTGPDGTWGDWADLGGAGVQDAPSAVADANGRIEVFAVAAPPGARPAVLHWSQPTPDGVLAPDHDFPSVSPSGGIAVGTDPDRRPVLFYRQLSSGNPLSEDVRSYTMRLVQGDPDGRWAPETEPVGGGPDHGGSGAPAVASAPGPSPHRTVVAVRNRDGGVSVNREGADGRFGDWSDLAGFIVGVPAAGVDRDGLTDLVALGPDGRLRESRQREDGSFGDWSTVGEP
ncbi:PIG-L family deacetylase [Kitasatospora sp. SUK 42]|uniref:PIG-L family deacetylase n=1 Tax=Kitasatospora sp. SUK 42 TaxID=1588882 RepID=UPI0018CAD4CA|nr:PIG-L family deacetylase [Kitasatospora sp. SUK 42]MBV2151779.1 PIG-L family deacetylase [Kitasatospora sp. SUK 42]